MKTVFMTLYGPLETDARVLRSIEAATKAGLKVEILTCNTSKNYVAPNDVVVINKPFTALGGLPFIKYLIACIVYFISNRKRIDVLYLHDFFSPIIGVLCYPFCRGKKIIYDAHELILTRPGDKVCLRDRFFIWAESNVVSKVDLIIEANKEREEIFKQRYPMAKTANVLNITRFKNFENRSFNGKDVLIAYQGALTEERKLSFYIDAFSKIDNMKLLMIGGGISMELYKKKVKDLGIEDRIEFTGRLSNADMMEKLRECTIGIISYPFTNLNNIYCSPNKIFEYAAISLPFIATSQPFIKEVEEKYHIGRTFEFGNVDSFVENINKILENYSYYNENTGKFLDDYNYEKELDKLVHIFKNI